MNGEKYERGVDILSSCIKHMNIYPKIIFDIGARDCKESIGLSLRFSATDIYAFECNANTIDICKKNIENHPRITLIEKAISDKDGEISFFPIDQAKTITTRKDGNPGASSLFLSSGKYTIEQYVQNKVTVESIRIDTFIERSRCIPDIIWMDIQGAELLALRGAGRYLEDIKVIYTEVEFIEIYKGQALYHDILDYMKKNGFKIYKYCNIHSMACDIIFVNTRFYNFSFLEDIYHKYGFILERLFLIIKLPFRILSYFYYRILG